VTTLAAIISCFPYYYSHLEDWVHEWEVTEEPQWFWEVVAVEADGWEIVVADKSASCIECVVLPLLLYC
jgi:hypothetical protein